jgi:hypothetical protein
MSGFGRGLAFLKEQQEKMGGRYGDRMQKLWLKNGESARFVFVQDHEDIAVPLVHMVEAFKRNGDKYNRDVLCARRSMSEDPGVCTVCLTEGSKGPWPRFVAIVWSDLIVHPTKKDGASWAAVKVAGSTETFYKEEVNDYRLLIMREKLTSQIQAYLAGDPLDPNIIPPDSILPVWWRYKVTGEGAQKLEFLEEVKNYPITAEAAEARKNAPALEDVIRAEFGTAPRVVAEGSGRKDDAELVEYTAAAEAAEAAEAADSAGDSEDITF